MDKNIYITIQILKKIGFADGRWYIRCINKSEIGLTETLEDIPFKTVVSQVLKELEKIGVSYKKEKNLSLKEVVIKHFGSYNGELSNKRIGQ